MVADTYVVNLASLTKTLRDKPLMLPAKRNKMEQAADHTIRLSKAFRIENRNLISNCMQANQNRLLVGETTP